LSPPIKPGEDPEIRRLLKVYVGAKNSTPPSPDAAERETAFVEAMVSKMESFERTRQDLAKQLNASIRDSGTFTPLGQEGVDNMLLRAEVTRLQSENAELKAIIKKWEDRKTDWTIRIIMGALGVMALYIWTLVTAGRK
jgi:hypothetical protein